MALLADNLLDMAMLQAGGVRLRKDWQSLEELVVSATRMLEQPLRAHPLRLTRGPELPLVNCDAVLVERVLVNLLENATKYTGPGTVIGVTASAETDQLTVEVWDQGPGLPAGNRTCSISSLAFKSSRRCRASVSDWRSVGRSSKPMAGKSGPRIGIWAAPASPSLCRWNPAAAAGDR